MTGPVPEPGRQAAAPAPTPPADRAVPSPARGVMPAPRAPDPAAGAAEATDAGETTGAVTLGRPNGQTRPAGAATPVAAGPPTAAAGTVYGSRPPSDDPDRDGYLAISGRMPQLRIGSHTVSRQVLAGLGVASTDAGLVVGAGMVVGAGLYRHPAVVPVFRPEPTRLCVVGAARLAAHLAFRALAFGARVAVVTTDPDSWQGLKHEATGRSRQVAIMSEERPFQLTATAQRPILLIYDLGWAGPGQPPPLGPWQSQLTVLRRFTPEGAPVVQESHPVLLQRVDRAGAARLGSTLHLSGGTVEFLQAMDEQMVVIVDGSGERRVWLVDTDIERSYCAGGTHGV